jgi:hypothetical protein
MEGVVKWTGTEHMQQIKCSSVYDVKLHMPSNAPPTENKFLKILFSKCQPLVEEEFWRVTRSSTTLQKKSAQGLVFTRCGVPTMV